jgi:hypothetical protein
MPTWTVDRAEEVPEETLRDEHPGPAASPTWGWFAAASHANPAAHARVQTRLFTVVAARSHERFTRGES